LIIDCDLRRRNVNNLLDITPERGLLEVLTGRAAMQDVIVTDTASGMDVLPLASSSFTPEDVFDTAAMNELLREASSKYDLVILDTAPVLAVSDTRILSAKADAVVFLAKWRQTPVNAVEAAIKLLESSGAYVGGVVLSQVDMKRQVRYGYGDQTYYYAKYRKYYQDDSGR
jgi:Mrp family chromosome partitioning ATPase